MLDRANGTGSRFQYQPKGEGLSLRSQARSPPNYGREGCQTPGPKPRPSQVDGHNYLNLLDSTRKIRRLEELSAQAAKQDEKCSQFKDISDEDLLNFIAKRGRNGPPPSQGYFSYLSTSKNSH